jgi:hypothetical protein
MAIALITLTRKKNKIEFIKLYSAGQVAQAVAYGSEQHRIQRFYGLTQVQTHPLPHRLQIRQPHQGIILPSKKNVLKPLCDLEKLIVIKQRIKRVKQELTRE